jgi:hypothetical protein
VILRYPSLPQPWKKQNDFFGPPPHKVIAEARSMDKERADVPIIFLPSPTASKSKTDLARELAAIILQEEFPEKIRK